MYAGLLQKLDIFERRTKELPSWTCGGKHAHDYVSYVDKESEVRVVKALTALLPEAGFITEEGSATYQDEPYCWVIDPLDGTTNYIHDEAPYCVSIALRSRTELLLGVVYEVCRDECFYAWKGGKRLWMAKKFMCRTLRTSKMHLSLQNYLIIICNINNGSSSDRSALWGSGRHSHEWLGCCRNLLCSYWAFDAWMEAFLGNGIILQRHWLFRKREERWLTFMVRIIS